MKLVQGRRPDGVVIAGALDGDRVTQLNADATDPILPLLTVAESDRAELAKKVASTSDSYSLDEIRLLPPVRAPGKVLAVARGYQRETEPEVPSEAAPYLFLKRADDVLGPADEITIGPPATSVVAEIEIALVIGRTARNLSVDEAVGCIAGYTIANDVSARSLDLPAAGRRDRTMDGFIDWLNGKWLDGFLVMGPALVTADEWQDGGQVELTTRIAGTTTVQGRTQHLLFGFDEIVSFASHLMTLHPGDVILTGMPETPKPERALAPGDVVEGEVTGLGVLRTEVVGRSGAH